MRKKILGYSLFFNKENDFSDFIQKIPSNFNAEINESEKEIMFIGVDPIKKEDFYYVLKYEGEEVFIEPSKIMFIETLFERKD